MVPGTKPSPSHAGMWDVMGTLPADLPKIIVVEDLTKPVIYGSMWGEVNILKKKKITFFLSPR